MCWIHSGYVGPSLEGEQNRDARRTDLVSRCTVCLTLAKSKNDSLEIGRETQIEQAAILHALGKESQRPVGGLEEKSVGTGHERRDDVDALGDACDAHVLGLAHENVESSYYTEHVGEVVRLLETPGAGSFDLVPDVPYVVEDLDVACGDLLLAVVPVEERLCLVDLGEVD